MAVTLEGGCCVSDMREGAPVVNGTLRIWNQIGKANGAQAISLRVIEFAPGLSPGIRNGDSDEILYVLGEENGALEITIRIDDYEHPIGGDTGIYIRPRQTFAIDNPNANPVVVISSRCPDTAATPEFVAAVAACSPPSDSEPSPIVQLRNRAPQSTADRWYRVLVDGEVGSRQVTQFVGSIPPGRAPDHFHTYEEVLFILNGEGRMWAGETNTPIGVGSCIYLPKRQVHCVENTGKGALRLLGVFYPAGSPSVRYEA